MPKQPKPQPKHRGTPRKHLAVEAPKTALRNTLVVSSVAVTVTGVTVGGGLIGHGSAGSGSDVAHDTSAASLASASLPDATGATGATIASAAHTGVSVDRLPSLSRSADRRAAVVPAKQTALSAAAGPAVGGSETLSDQAPTDIARSLLSAHGWDDSQFGCLDSLWQRESGWNVYAQNPSSSAYGIPQALPGSKMASAGADWATNPVTQIQWGLGYIADRYGSPCGAWGHSESYGWY